ncbi:MAG: CBS domain-containing protein [Deltaproteobacteria bacterium]|nr:CBS domain-containing protein [Deltaproteobacteria bacterium]
MKCPFCGSENIAGSDDCDDCGEDLTAFDGVRPSTRLEKSIAKDALSTLPGSAPICLGPDTKLRAVADQLALENRSVLIVDAGKLVGIVTERDLLFKVMGKVQDWETIPVSQIMTRNPDTLEFGDKIAYALHKMALGGFRHIPILHEGRPERVVSVRDILEYLAEMFPNAVGIHESNP